MKKVLFFAAASAILASGCVVGGETPATHKGDVKLTVRLGGIAQANNTRAIGEAAKYAAGTIDFTNGKLLVFGDQETVVSSVAFPSNVISGSATSWELTDPVSAEAKVYVVANLPAGVLTDPVGMTLDEINEVVADITTQTDYKTVVLSSANYAVKALTVTKAPNTDASGSPGEANVSINVAPVVSRLEVGSVKGSGNVTGFTVEAVYLTEYYPRFTLGGSFSGEKFSFDAATPGAGIGDVQSFVANGSKIAAPASSNVWGYNVAAGSLPLLIVELSDVTLSAGSVNGDKQYLSVTGYSNGVSAFTPGKVYHIDEIVFNETHIASTPALPPTDGVTLTAEIIVAEWNEAPTNPILETNADYVPNPVGEVAIELSPAVGTLIVAKTNLSGYKTFAESESDYGAYFQWGYNTAFDATANPVTSGWQTVAATTPTWNPCPQGWRLPTDIEAANLINLAASGTGVDGSSLYTRYKWTSGASNVPGAGFIFYDKDDVNYEGEPLFVLPNAGYRTASNGNRTSFGARAFIWTSVSASSDNTYVVTLYAYVGTSETDRFPFGRVATFTKRYGFNVRCVRTAE